MEKEDECVLSPKYHEEEQLWPLTNNGNNFDDDLYLDVVSPPCAEGDIALQPFSPVLVTEEDSSPSSIPFASLEILKIYKSRINKVNGNTIHGQWNETAQGNNSINKIIELASKNFIQSNSQVNHHPYAASFSESDDVRLVQDLLSCAEKVCHEKFDTACKLLQECYKVSCSRTTAVQRMVYYFAEALGEKIDRETGKFTGKGAMMSQWLIDANTPSSSLVALHKKLPLTQITQFTSIQLIADQVSSHRRVHIIELDIRSGVHMTVLMQVLASRSECPLEHLKITAFSASDCQLTAGNNPVGLLLETEAKFLNLNFSFNLLTLDDTTELRRNLLVRDADEAVVVHAEYFLMKMISKQKKLESLMMAIKRINPLVMIIAEAEANVNSPVFVNRFVEALFFYGAYFDCAECCFKNDEDDADRTFVESRIFAPSIRDLLAADAEERRLRIVGLDTWRAFFARFGMVEMELSKSSLDHATSVAESLECGEYCSLSLDGKCLVVGWKGTPVHSLSAWKIKERRSRKKYRI